jgi:hypothetical protein
MNPLGQYPTHVSFVYSTIVIFQNLYISAIMDIGNPNTIIDKASDAGAKSSLVGA